MNAKKVETCNWSSQKWILCLLHLTFFAIFGVAAVNKFIMGPSATVGYFHQLFANAWLPMWWVTFFAWVLPYIEAVLAVWLITGICRRCAWVASSLLIICLGFGLAVAGKWNEAAMTYFYLILTLPALYLSDCCSRKNS